MPLYTFRFYPGPNNDDYLNRTITVLGISWESAEQAAKATLRLNLNRNPDNYAIVRIGEPKALPK